MTVPSPHAQLWRWDIEKALKNDYVFKVGNNTLTGDQTIIGAVGIGVAPPANMVNGGLYANSHISTNSFTLNGYYDGAWKAINAGYVSLFSQTASSGYVYLYRSATAPAAGGLVTGWDTLMSFAATTGDLTIPGVINCNSNIFASPILGVKASSGNVHVWFYGPNSEDRCVIYTPAASAGNVTFRVNGTQNFTFASSGTFTSPGHIVASDYVYSNGGYFIGTTTLAVLGTALGGSGTIYLRPTAYNSGSNQTSIDANGNMVVNGTIQSTNTIFAATYFQSTSVTAILGTTGAGTVYMRPNGAGSSAGQAWLGSDGVFHIVAGYAANVIGINLQEGLLQLSGSGSASDAMCQWGNINGNVGGIYTSGTTTSYNTTSDEDLKDFVGPYDPMKAIEIIRADPVRDFHWKKTGEYAVGWGAQTSYAISKDLATPPPLPGNKFKGKQAERMLTAKPGDTDYMPWGMDQAKRTPYLWAALGWALDRIDELTERVTALEAA
jgi:hypothetical protein